MRPNSSNRPNRQVRRSNTRPSYVRRGRARPSRLSNLPKLPKVEVSWIRWSVVGVTVLLLMLGIAQSTKLKRLSVVGAQGAEQKHLEQVAADGAKKQRFGRNTFLLNGGVLADYIEEVEPGVRQAKVSRNGLNEVQIKVTERQPRLNWQSNNTIYLLDSDGTVIGESKGRYLTLPTVIDSNNLPAKPGEKVAPVAFITFASDLARRLPEAGLVAKEMTVPETTSELNVKTDKNYSLKLDTTRPLEGELSDLKAVQAELKRSGKTPTQYIDLRIERKAYYK